MKCNIKKGVTSSALYQADLDCIQEGLDLLEKDIQDFLARKNFKEVSEENANQNLGHIESVRKKLEDSRQSFSLNELKVIYIGLNFLRDDLGRTGRAAQREKPQPDRPAGHGQKTGCAQRPPENNRGVHPDGRGHSGHTARILTFLLPVFRFRDCVFSQKRV